MRPIKFRGLNKSCGFLFGSYATDGKDYHAIITDNPKDSSTMLNIAVVQSSVGQFTGLQDKNGVDIYEGDLISLHGNQRGFTKVVFNAYIGGWLLVRNNNASSLGSRMRKDLEIVGNIYQNPELLELNK